ncbi:MAG: SMC-Scp complex subunit ScpB [Clostridiales bacterium]
MNVLLKNIESIIESLLYASGNELSLDKISAIVGLDKKETKSILKEMEFKYFNEDRGIMLREINSSYQLCTKFEYHEYIKKLFEPKNQRQGLSQAAFETLAIVAYNQPVTKARIESIRGVSCDSTMIKLLERSYIKESGRMDSPGKPILYSTTINFLRSFGLNSVNELRGYNMNSFQEVNKDGTLRSAEK